MTNFNPQRGLIIVPVTLYGPTGDAQARLAVDAGANATVIGKDILASIGYAPDAQPQTV